MPVSLLVLVTAEVVMSHQSGSPSPERPSSPRAVSPIREQYTDQARGLSASPGVTDLPRAEHVPPAPQSEPSLESTRAELAYRDWNAIPESARPLSKASEDLSKAFDEMLHMRSMRGDMASSNPALARLCGIDEKGIRQWRKNDKRLPLAALLTLPASVSVEIIQWISHRRGLGRPACTPLGQLDDALTAVEKTLAADDRAGIKAAQKRLLAMLDKLDEGGR